MSKLNKRRLTRKLLTLGLLLFSLALLTSGAGQRTAIAVPDCSACEDIYVDCLTQNPAPGSCDSQYFWCQTHCRP
jgi:hypothetical protein